MTANGIRGYRNIADESPSRLGCGIDRFTAIETGAGNGI